MEREPLGFLQYWAAFGPMIGIFLGFGCQWLNQWHIRKQEDKRRYHKIRIEAYSNYIKNVNSLYYDMLNGKPNESKFDEIMLSTAQVSIISSDDLKIHAAEMTETLRSALWDLQNARKYFKNFTQHQHNFMRLARKELLIN
jgi:hypothetical protein